MVANLGAFRQNFNSKKPAQRFPLLIALGCNMAWMSRMKPAFWCRSISKIFKACPRCQISTNIADWMVRARSANEMSKSPPFWWSFLYQAPSFSWVASSKHKKCWTYLRIQTIQMLLMKVLFRFGFISVCSIYCTQRLKEWKRRSDESDATTKTSCWAE